MSEPAQPGENPRALMLSCLAIIPQTIQALYPLAPFALVAYALGSAANGAPENAWLPLLVGGAVLIDPKPKGPAQ